jgi:hypothetical protein
MIPLDAVGELEPAWSNDFIPGLDAAALYAFTRSRTPSRYIEIGSGNSTKFVAHAKRDGALDTSIVSVDPLPRAEIDQLCDRVIREPLETTSLSPFSELQAGDIVFVDGSHRVFMNNDVVTFFLDLLPGLAAGVLIGIHDIYLPYDYPLQIADRLYSEQYVLAAYLLAAPRVKTVFPAHWAGIHMASELELLWENMPNGPGITRHGGAYWLETVQQVSRPPNA